MNQKKQMSESLIIGALLALAGGFLDAYTYITRGGVFANAQTGNVVLMGVNFSEGNIRKMISYFIPIFSFVVGIIIAEIVKKRYKNKHTIHWRQIIIGIECITLFVVAFIPDYYNTAANVLVSFVCALQVETFRKLNGNTYATTMCTGNLRSAAENMYTYAQNKDRDYLNKSIQYFCVIGVFIVGAGLGTVVSKIMELKAVLIVILILAAAGLLMLIDTDKKDFK